MDLFEQIKIKEKIEELTNRWKGKKPEKNSSEWWRYRADQSLYITLKAKLK
jgi:hypothetical protein